MSHLMVCNGGTWFKFSDGFANLLISQLEAAIDKKDVMVCVRTNLLNGKTVAWTDSSADDYLYPPKHPDIDGLCSYKMIMEYKKLYKSFKQMTGTAAWKHDDCDADGDEHCDDVDGNEGIKHGLWQLGYQKYVFSEEHPGCKYPHLSKLVLSVIPKVCLPRGRWPGARHLRVLFV